MTRRTYQACTAMCVLLFAAVWVVAFHTGWGRSADLHVLESLANRIYYRPGVISVLNDFAVLCNPLPYALLASLVLLIAYVRLGKRPTLLLGGTLLVSQVFAQVLKSVLASDRMGTRFIGHIDAAAFPSGHATASLTLAGFAFIAAPAFLRPVVAAGGALFSLMMAFAVVGLGWHYPSDVLGGWALAGAFVGIAYLLVEDPTREARSAARLPERLFGAVGAPRQDEQQV